MGEIEKLEVLFKEVQKEVGAEIFQVCWGREKKTMKEKRKRDG